jgi:hypothetical protein
MGRSLGAPPMPATHRGEACWGRWGLGGLGARRLKKVDRRPLSPCRPALEWAPPRRSAQSGGVYPSPSAAATRTCRLARSLRDFSSIE